MRSWSRSPRRGGASSPSAYRPTLNRSANANLPQLASAVEDVAKRAGDIDAVVAHSVGCAATTMALAGGGLALRRVAFVAPPLKYEAFVRYYAQQHEVGGDVLVAALAELGLDVAPLDIRKNAATIDVPLTIVHSTDDLVASQATLRRSRPSGNEAPSPSPKASATHASWATRT